MQALGQVRAQELIHLASAKLMERLRDEQIYFLDLLSKIVGNTFTTA